MRKSGEGEIPSKPFSEVLVHVGFVAQVVNWLALVFRWLLPVSSGHFRLICNRFSTVSAQVLMASRFDSLKEEVTRRKAVATPTQCEGSRAACYTRYSSDNQDEKSIEDQLRECREAALRNGQGISEEFHFSDEAVSGATVVREGLDLLRKVAERGEFQTLYVYSLSRLSRETSFGLPLLKELNSVHKVRIISVSESIDSNQAGWYEVATIMEMLHERQLKEISANTRRGLIGTIISPYSGGDFVVGYTSIPSTDGATRRRGGVLVPRRVYAIDPIGSVWVLAIFTWYATEGHSLSWIADQLNEKGVRKDHRSSTREWTTANVRTILKNERYVGKWSWGRTKRVRNPITGKVTQEVRPTSEISPEWLREYPHLRLIDDELFERAQRRLKADADRFSHLRNANGTLAGSTSDRPATHPLRNLIHCAKCGRPFIRAGNKTGYLRCSGSFRKQCDVRTVLRRDRAGQLILEAVEARVLNNPRFIDAVLDQTFKLWREDIARQPDALRCTESERASIRQKVDRITRQIEEDDDPPQNLVQRLKERNQELEALDRRIAQLLKSTSESCPEPTREWIETNLRGRLLDNLLNGSPRDIEAFQDLFSEPIQVHECGRDGRKKKYFRAVLAFDSQRLSSLLLGRPAGETAETVREVVEIDIRPPLKSDEQARRAHGMWSEGASCEAIAAELGVSPSRVTALFDHASRALGLPKPDTKSRRPRTALQQRISEEVVRRHQRGELLIEIADALGVSRPTIDRCLKRWCRGEGVAQPDGRTRRKSLSVKQRETLTLPTSSSDENNAISKVTGEDGMSTLEEPFPPEAADSAA